MFASSIKRMKFVRALQSRPFAMIWIGQATRMKKRGLPAYLSMTLNSLIPLLVREVRETE